MAAKKPSMDSTQEPGTQFIKRIEELRETLQIITGKRGTRIAKITDPSTATAKDCATKLNEIIDLLQG